MRNLSERVIVSSLTMLLPYSLLDTYRRPLGGTTSMLCRKHAPKMANLCPSCLSVGTVRLDVTPEPWIHVSRSAGVYCSNMGAASCG
jgi:hypothetical protein